MAKVTRIVKSKNLNRRKYDELSAQALLLGKLRREIWQRFGSINGSGIDFRELRNEWVKTRDFSPLPAKAWKETLRDVLDDIAMFDEASKLKVKEAIYKRVKDKDEQKRFFKALKAEDWKKDPYLCRKMRQYKPHGRTRVSNQIILETGVYSQFQGIDGNTWLKVPTFERGQKLAIPLDSNVKLKGCLRLILKDGEVEVHYAIEKKQFRPCGDRVLGIDKGYTEAFADSEGGFHGEGLGKLLSEGTEKRKNRGIARNKLFQIAKKKPHKARNIYRFNLGRQKLNRYNKRQQQHIRGIAFQAAHSLNDLAKEVRAEDLTKVFASKEKWKDFNRRMSSWTKGYLSEAIKSVCEARGSCLRLVNAAYTSQMDSKTRRLEGRRVGDKFYHANVEVSHADTNAAVNIRDRADDTEIGLYTPHTQVKKILLERMMADGGVSPPRDDRPSRTPVAHQKWASTESEGQENRMHTFA